MQESVCLGCERTLQVPSNLNVGDTFTCPQCQTDLEIASLDPPVLDWPHDDTYDDWDESSEDDYEDDWLDDDDEWLDDEDDDYSWMLTKQKRHQEIADLDRRRPPRPNPPRGGASQPTPRRVDTRRKQN